MNNSFVCPHCGEEIKKNATVCPHCGSDDETGWSRETYLDGIDLPDDDAYEEIRRNEFGGERSSPSRRLWIYLTGAAVVAVFVIGIFMAVFSGG